MRRKQSKRAGDAAYRAIGRALASRAEASARLFVGVYPCGIVYADRGREVAGDYARLAFLPYRTLALEIERDCPQAFRAIIAEDAKRYRNGQTLQISTSGQSVRLGVEVSP